MSSVVHSDDGEHLVLVLRDASPRRAVAEALGGLPPIKMHCSVLAEEGIHQAINDYRVRQGLEPWEEKNPRSHDHHPPEDED